MMLNWQRYGAALAILQAALTISACKPEPPLERREGVAPVAKRIAVTGPERLVVAFGDSLYAGYGLAPGQSLPAELERDLRRRGINATVVNAGVSGDTSAAARQRLVFTLDRLPRKPDLILLGIGGNDMLRQIPVAETRANLIAMLDELQHRRIAVVLTGMLAPPNLGPDYAGPFNAIWPALARQYNAPLDPFILDGVVGNPSLMLADGLHPNARGVRLIATRVTPIVEKSLPREP